MFLTRPSMKELFAERPFPMLTPTDDLIAPTPFSVGGRVFICAALRTPAGTFQPVAMCQAVDGKGGMTKLPSDTEPCESAAEAVRLAEQQAARWTRDGTGSGNSNGPARF